MNINAYIFELKADWIPFLNVESEKERRRKT